MFKRVNKLTFRPIALLLVLSALFLAFCDGSGKGNGNTQTCGMNEAEKQLLDLINDLRASGTDCGGTTYGSTHPLQCHPALVTAAQEHSMDMAENNYFDHASQDGRSPWDRMRDAGYTGGGSMGENIAAGRSDPASVRAMWEGSPQHCANMMNPAFGVAGIGHAYAEGSQYGDYWTLDLAAGE